MVSTRARTHMVMSRRKHEHGHELGISDIGRRNISGFDWPSLIGGVGSEDAASVTDGLGLNDLFCLNPILTCLKCNLSEFK